MKIAIIGSGNVGGAIAKKLSMKGHQITFGVRDIKKFKGKALTNLKNISVKLIESAVYSSEIIILATPALKAIDVTKSLGATSGKIIIDTMNIIQGNGPEGYSNTSDAILDNTESNEVIKCFNTTGFNNMDNPSYNGENIEIFMAGDSLSAKKIVKTLAIDIGFSDCIDIGGNDKFELMEKFAFFWINLAIIQGHGRDIGFKLQRR